MRLAYRGREAEGSVDGAIVFLSAEGRWGSTERFRFFSEVVGNVILYYEDNYRRNAGWKS